MGQDSFYGNTSFRRRIQNAQLQNSRFGLVWLNGLGRFQRSAKSHDGPVSNRNVPLPFGSEQSMSKVNPASAGIRSLEIESC